MGCAQHPLTDSVAVRRQVARPEHISLSVPDPVAMVKWYTKNLGMIVMREGSAPNFNFFIADSGRHILLELANNADYVPIDLPKVNYMSMHLAFMVKNMHIFEPRNGSKDLVKGKVLMRLV